MRRSALARSGKAPMARVRRLISPCRRSRPLVAWVDRLVADGQATMLIGGGYPRKYTVKTRDVASLLPAPPEARERWVHGAEDIVDERWAGKTTVEDTTASACADDEWLILEAWDES